MNLPRTLPIKDGSRHSCHRLSKRTAKLRAKRYDVSCRGRSSPPTAAFTEIEGLQCSPRPRLCADSSPEQPPYSCPRQWKYVAVVDTSWCGIFMRGRTLPEQDQMCQLDCALTNKANVGIDSPGAGPTGVHPRSGRRQGISFSQYISFLKYCAC